MISKSHHREDESYYAGLKGNAQLRRALLRTVEKLADTPGVDKATESEFYPDFEHMIYRMLTKEYNEMIIENNVLDDSRTHKSLEQGRGSMSYEEK